MKKDLLKIINHYRLKNQLKKFNEECYELIEAIRDYEEQKEACENIGCEIIHIDKCREHITEEFADVMVMLEQLRLYYYIPIGDIKKVMEYKVKRQLERLKESDVK